MNEKVEKVLCASLIFDWAIWPRHESGGLDSTNVSRMMDAIQAGIILPPIVVERKTMRIVDGFHRTKAYEKLFGEKAEIDVVFREYKDEAAVFMEATTLNASQGLPLSPMDKAHVVIVAMNLKIPISTIAKALGIEVSRAVEFLARRSVMCTDGERRPVAAGASKLASQLNEEGRKPSIAQEQFLLHTNGMFPMRNARLVLDALRAEGSFEMKEETVVLLKALRDEINRVLGKENMS